MQVRTRPVILSWSESSWKPDLARGPPLSSLPRPFSIWIFQTIFIWSKLKLFCVSVTEKREHTRRDFMNKSIISSGNMP